MSPRTKRELLARVIGCRKVVLAILRDPADLNGIEGDGNAVDSAPPNLLRRQHTLRSRPARLHDPGGGRNRVAGECRVLETHRVPPITLHCSSAGQRPEALAAWSGKLSNSFEGGLLNPA